MLSCSMLTYNIFEIIPYPSKRFFPFPVGLPLTRENEMIVIAGKIRTRVREKTPYRTGDKKRNRRFILRGSIPFAKRTSMPEISPHCGKESREISPRFCSGCGARMNGRTRRLSGSAPPYFPVSVWCTMAKRQKGILSFCLPLWDCSFG